MLSLFEPDRLLFSPFTPDSGEVPKNFEGEANRKNLNKEVMQGERIQSTILEILLFKSVFFAATCTDEDSGRSGD